MMLSHMTTDRGRAARADNGSNPSPEVRLATCLCGGAC